VANYDLEVRKSAVKEIAALPKRECRAIVETVQALAKDPRAPGSEKLSGDDKYRIRHGDYRVVYEIDDTNRRVTIVRVANRREVYRR
jgi:mRNA interferase RelE/StbE